MVMHNETLFPTGCAVVIGGSGGAAAPQFLPVATVRVLCHHADAKDVAALMYHAAFIN